MRPLRLLAALVAVGTLAAGCITDPDAPPLDFEGQKGFTVIPLHPPSVYLSSDFFGGANRDPALSRVIEDRIRASLSAQGFRVMASRADADYELSTDLRAWWVRNARFAWMTTLTLTVYTPLDYKWILDVDLTDRDGQPVGGTHERGGFRFETFGIIFFPATIAAYQDLVVPKWHEVAEKAADRSAEVLVSAAASGLSPAQ